MSNETDEGRGAVAGRVERPVVPVAWRLGETPCVEFGPQACRPEHGWTPLYDQAALDAAVAAERERCLADCEAVGDLGAMLVAQRIRDRASCEFRRPRRRGRHRPRNIR